MRAFIAVPALREYNNLPTLVKDVENQDYKNVLSWICVNNPREWYGDDSHSADLNDNMFSLQFLQQIGAFFVEFDADGNLTDNSVNYLNNNDVRFVVIDKSSRDNAFPLKQSGVGWARKVLMDAITKFADNDDVIVSMDADTNFAPNYISFIVDNFKCHRNAVALSVPYYHPLSGNESVDRCILRYETYMRHYMLNMLRISNKYAFTALGSAIAFPVNSYIKVRGITPRTSGEDFYLLQKFRKIGDVLLWNECHVYPKGRLSDRVAFGTGPALIKGVENDWSSYPFYDEILFDEVKQTYDLFPELFDVDNETPMSDFLCEIFSENDLWGPLRKNFKKMTTFVNACSTKVDALRILQYLRYRYSCLHNSLEVVDSNTISNRKHSVYSAEYLRNVFSQNSIDEMKVVRDCLYEQENELRKLHDKLM